MHVGTELAGTCAADEHCVSLEHDSRMARVYLGIEQQGASNLVYCFNQAWRVLQLKRCHIDKLCAVKWNETDYLEVNTWEYSA